MSFQGEYAAQVLGLGAEGGREEPAAPAPAPRPASRPLADAPARTASPKKENNHAVKFNNVGDILHTYTLCMHQWMGFLKEMLMFRVEK